MAICFSRHTITNRSYIILHSVTNILNTMASMPWSSHVWLPSTKQYTVL